MGDDYNDFGELYGCMEGEEWDGAIHDHQPEPKPFRSKGRLVVEVIRLLRSMSNIISIIYENFDSIKWKK